MDISRDTSIVLPTTYINSLVKISFDYFVMVAPPGGFFTFMKMLPKVSFIIKIIKKVFLSVLIATISR